MGTAGFERTSDLSRMKKGRRQRSPGRRRGAAGLGLAHVGRDGRAFLVFALEHA
jgi:transposase